MASASHRDNPGAFIGAGAVSFMFLFLAFLAYHDIGAGETDLRNEYGILVVAAVWMVFVCAWLLRVRRLSLAATTLTAVACLAWATIETAPAPAPFTIQSYWFASVGYVWLIVLAALLVRRGYRLARQS